MKRKRKLLVKRSLSTNFCKKIEQNSLNLATELGIGSVVVQKSRKNTNKVSINEVIPDTPSCAGFTSFESCCNCGTSASILWHENPADQSIVVCNDCALYLSIYEDELYMAGRSGKFKRKNGAIITEMISTRSSTRRRRAVNPESSKNGETPLAKSTYNFIKDSSSTIKPLIRELDLNYIYRDKIFEERRRLAQFMLSNGGHVTHESIIEKFLTKYTIELDLGNDRMDEIETDLGNDRLMNRKMYYNVFPFSTKMNDDSVTILENGFYQVNSDIRLDMIINIENYYPIKGENKNTNSSEEFKFIKKKLLNKPGYILHVKASSLKLKKKQWRLAQKKNHSNHKENNVGNYVGNYSYRRSEEPTYVYLIPKNELGPFTLKSDFQRKYKRINTPRKNPRKHRLLRYDDSSNLVSPLEQSLEQFPMPSFRQEEQILKN